MRRRLYGILAVSGFVAGMSTTFAGVALEKKMYYSDYITKIGAVITEASLLGSLYLISRGEYSENSNNKYKNKD